MCLHPASLLAAAARLGCWWVSIKIWKKKEEAGLFTSNNTYRFCLSSVSTGEKKKFATIWIVFTEVMYVYFSFILFGSLSPTSPFHKCSLTASQHSLITVAMIFLSGIERNLLDNISGASCGNLKTCLVDKKQHNRIALPLQENSLMTIGGFSAQWTLFPASHQSIEPLLWSACLLKSNANKTNKRDSGQNNSNFYSSFSRLGLETLVKSPRTALSAGVSGPRQIKAVSELSCQELMWFFRSNYGEVMVAFGDGWLFCQSPAISFLSVGDTAGRAELLRVIGQ